MDFRNSVRPMAQGEDRMMAKSEEIFEVGGPVIVERIKKNNKDAKKSRSLSENSEFIRQCLGIARVKQVRLRSVSKRSVCRYASMLSRPGASTRFRGADYEV